jgi:RNA polymerase sigma factor (sigma-70 family)
VISDASTDEALAAQAANGDEGAFTELVRRHKEPLYRLLRRYTDNSDDAYEAAHEAFIAAWVSIRRYDTERPFLAWLRTIAINKARDRGRRAAFRRLMFGARTIEESGALSQADAAIPADELISQRQDGAALDRAVAHLPARLKEALLLTAFDGWSHQEAGQILGVSTKTIETRVYRARKILELTIDPNLKPKR